MRTFFSLDVHLHALFSPPLFLLTIQADAHDARDLQAVKRDEPDLYRSVSSRLTQALKLY